MTHKLIQESILAASAAMVVSGFMGLMPSNHLKIFLAGGSVFVGRRLCLQLKEKIERDITTQVRLDRLENYFKNLEHILQSLEEDITTKIKPEINASVENCHRQHQSAKDRFDNIEHYLKNLENVLQCLEQEIATKIKPEINASVENFNRQNQSTQDRINNLKNNLKTFEDRLASNLNSPSPIILKTQSPKPTKEEELAKSDEIIKWLNERDIKIEKYYSPKNSVSAQKLDELAIYLGQHYGSLAEIHKKLMGSIRYGSGFRFSLIDRTQKEIQINTKFGSMLKEAGCLSNYYYDRTNKVMHIGVHHRTDFEKFIFGDWFERFISDRVTAFFKAQGLKSEYLANVEVVFTNGDRYELDLLFLVKEHLFWIECKAGQNFDESLPRYSDNHQKYLQLPKTNALVSSST
jgi:RNAse (barnase) inhibitor barstar